MEICKRIFSVPLHGKDREIQPHGCWKNATNICSSNRILGICTLL